MAHVLKAADIPVGNIKEIHPATRMQDADTMVPDVRKSFVTLAQEKMRKSEPEAGAWLDELAKQKRYLVDIWGVRAI